MKGIFALLIVVLAIAAAALFLPGMFSGGLQISSRTQTLNLISTSSASSVSQATFADAKSYEWLLPESSITLVPATTSDEQTAGLSGWPSLPTNEGMFFIFPTAGDYGFWMKDMEFPLDIIWLDSDFTVTHIEKDLSPSTYPQIYLPGAPSLYVVEANAGTAQKYSLEVGQKLDILQ